MLQSRLGVDVTMSLPLLLDVNLSVSVVSCAVPVQCCGLLSDDPWMSVALTWYVVSVMSPECSECHES